MNKKSNCIIIDDDPLIVAQLGEFLEQTQLFEQPYVSGNVYQANSIFKEHAIDLLFLDIELPDMNGLDFLRSLTNPCPTIVVSAHPHYALDCYDCDVKDFLYKPLIYSRFLRSIRRALMQAPTHPNETNTSHYISSGLPFQVVDCKNNVSLPSPIHIYLKAGHIHHRFVLSEILYLEAANIYTKIVTSAGATVVSDQISNLDERLNMHQFLRVHKSFVINVEQITSYNAKTIWLQNHPIPIGRKYQAMVKNFLRGIQEDRNFGI
jgi:DNA-binding LytR/AlgR family response regulator